MVYYLYILIGGGLTSNIIAQKHDYIWLSGYDGYPHPPEYYSSGFYLGTTVINFNYSPVQISLDSLQMNWDRTNVSFCDSNGNLLFYSNGIYVANALDEKIENGDSLNAGVFTQLWFPNMLTYGYRNWQGAIGLQSIMNSEQYFILHTFIDTFTGATDIYVRRLLYTGLDMSANAGHGAVLFKNAALIEDTLGVEITAVKHANGKNWWLLINKSNTNCYFRVLIDSTGPHRLSGLTCGGNDHQIGRGAACFSPDGSKYVYLGSHGGLNIFDFDRCSGELSNPVAIPLPVIKDSSWSGLGAAISPNNRFLYVSVTKHLYQYDMWAADIAASVDTVGKYDGFRLPFGSYFVAAQLAPDGKIYLSCGNAEAVYHVINNPDEKGAACDFQQHGIMLQSPSCGVPNFPNYRLGALPGGCSSIGISEPEHITREREIKVFPNPATDIVTVDYGFTDWSKSGEMTLEVINELGQVVHRQKLPMYSGLQRVDVSNYPSGIYTTYIKRNNQVIATSKFAKQ